MDLKVWKIKKTGQIVKPIGKVDTQRTLCLFPFEQKSNKGNLGHVQPVRDENIIEMKSV